MATESARVVIFDTTLRDGEQAPGFSLEVPAKVQMARALDALGVDIIEAGFPIASPADAEAVTQIAREVRRPVIAALARCRPLDIDEAARALAPAARRRIHTFLATSDLHLERKLRITREACLTAVVDGVRRARQFTDDVEFSAEDATRSDHDFLCRVVEAAIGAGATTINLPDTVGYTTPDETQEFFAEIIRRVPELRQGGLQRALPRRSGPGRRQQPGGDHRRRPPGRGRDQRHRRAGRQRGARRGRDGDARAEGSAAVRDGDPVDRGSSRRASCSRRLANEPVQANKAIVGRNAFAHEAGIHQDGVLKDARTYEIMRPQDVGQEPEQLVLGRHSGRHAVQRRCDALGLHVAAGEIDQVYRAVISFGEHRKIVGDGDLRRIVERLRGERPPTAPDDANGGHHVEHVGYGHGV